MEGPFETAVPYDAHRDDADRWQASATDIGAILQNTQSTFSNMLGSAQQQQPVMQQLEQQQQMRRADEPATEETLTPEQLKKKYEQALAWVKNYEPDHLW